MFRYISTETHQKQLEMNQTILILLLPKFMSQ